MAGSPMHSTTHCFKPSATIHHNAGQATQGGSQYSQLKGTGNGPDINRKFPEGANSQRKRSGLGT